MNKQQRIEISNAFSDVDFSSDHIATLETEGSREEYVKELETLKETLESIRDDEQEKFDNMPEGLQASERGSTLESNVSELDDAITNLNDAIDAVKNDYPAKPDESNVEEWAANIADQIENAQSTAEAL